MGNCVCCKSYIQIEDEKEELKTCLKNLDSGAVDLVRSSYRVEAAAEELTNQLNQLEQMTFSLDQDPILRSKHLASELKETMQADFKTPLWKMMKLLSETLHKMPSEYKIHLDNTIAIDSRLAINAELDNNEPMPLDDSNVQPEEHDERKSPEELAEKTKKDFEDKMKSLNIQIETLMAEKERLLLENKSLQQNLTDIYLFIKQIKRDSISEEEKDFTLSSFESRPDERQELLGPDPPSFNSQKLENYCEVRCLLDWLQNMLAKKDADIKEYNRIQTELDEQIQVVKLDLLQTHEHVNDKSSEIKTLQRDKESLEKQCNETTCLLMETNKMLKETSQELEELKRTCNDFEEKANKLSETLNEMSKQLTEQQQKNEELQEKITEVNENQRSKSEEAACELEKCKTMLNDCTLENAKLKEDIEELSKENHSLKCYYDTVVEENKTLHQEVDKLKRKPPCLVQVFSPSSSTLMKQMQTELVSLIRERLDASATALEVVLCESREKLKQDLPILLASMNISRLGTDAANALNGLQPNSKMALVVFHHKDTHALPNQASDRVLVDPTFKELGGIFDIAFLSEKGVYSCKMNEDNISKIIAFLLKLEQAK